MRRATTAGALTIAIALGVTALAGSETPPEGPPFVRDFAQAREDAIQQGKPIFVYLTKTY